MRQIDTGNTETQVVTEYGTRVTRDNHNLLVCFFSPFFV